MKKAPLMDYLREKLADDRTVRIKPAGDVIDGFIGFGGFSSHRIMEHFRLRGSIGPGKADGLLEAVVRFYESRGLGLAGGETDTLEFEHPGDSGNTRVYYKFHPGVLDLRVMEYSRRGAQDSIPVIEQHSRYVH